MACSKCGSGGHNRLTCGRTSNDNVIPFPDKFGGGKPDKFGGGKPDNAFPPVGAAAKLPPDKAWVKYQEKIANQKLKFEDPDSMQEIVVNRTWGGFPEIPDDALEEQGVDWVDTYDHNLRSQPWVVDSLREHKDVDVVRIPAGAHYKIYDNDGVETLYWSHEEIDTAKIAGKDEWKKNPDPTKKYVAINTTYGGFHIPQNMLEERGYKTYEEQTDDRLREENWVLEYAQNDDDMSVVSVPRAHDTAMWEYDGVEVILHSPTKIHFA